jgi:hypothetical protein
MSRYMWIEQAERDQRALKALLASPTSADALEAWERIPQDRRESAQATVAGEAANARHALNATGKRSANEVFKAHRADRSNPTLAKAYLALSGKELTECLDREAAEKRAVETVASLKDAIRAEAEGELWLLENPERADAVRWAQGTAAIAKRLTAE